MSVHCLPRDYFYQLPIRTGPDLVMQWIVLIFVRNYAELIGTLYSHGSEIRNVQRGRHSEKGIFVTVEVKTKFVESMLCEKIPYRTQGDDRIIMSLRFNEDGGEREELYIMLCTFSAMRIINNRNLYRYFRVPLRKRKLFYYTRL